MTTTTEKTEFRSMVASGVAQRHGARVTLEMLYAERDDVMSFDPKFLFPWRAYPDVSKVEELGRMWRRRESGGWVLHLEYEIVGRGEREVKLFSELMLEKLAERAHRGNWKAENILALRACLADEMTETLDEVKQFVENVARGGSNDECAERLKWECVDVALSAMFLADVVGGLKSAQELGKT